MKLIIETENCGKAMECQTTQELLSEIKREIRQETIAVKVFIENQHTAGKEAGRAV